MAPLFDPTPPAPRSRESNNPTLLYSWWCTMFSVVVIAIRIYGRFKRNKSLFREDKIMLYSILPLLARMACIHAVLILGTNNVQTTSPVTLSPLSIQRRSVGSRLVLAGRIFYALFIWMAKWTVSEFLKRLTDRFWKKNYEYGLRIIRIFLLVTFLAVVVATLGECQPFDHYWQVTPDPGHQCRQGYAHLLTMGVTDIMTDVLLVIFPIPIIVRSSMGLKRKVSLVLLFSMSSILVVITAARIPAVIGRHGLQQFRTVFASSEILAAAAVSNFIVLGSFLRDRGPKKNRYKSGSVGTDSMERRGSTRRPTLLAWGSDEDLARDLGYRLSPELRVNSIVPRPAPVANLDLLSRREGVSKFPGKAWNFPARPSGEISSVNRSTRSDQPPPSPLEVTGPPSSRRVSFFDVGGLLEEGSLANTTAPSPTDSVIAHDFAHRPRRGSSLRAARVASTDTAYLPSPARYPQLATSSGRRLSHAAQEAQLVSEESEIADDPSNDGPTPARAGHTFPADAGPSTASAANRHAGQPPSVAEDSYALNESDRKPSVESP